MAHSAATILGSNTRPFVAFSLISGDVEIMARGLVYLQHFKSLPRASTPLGWSLSFTELREARKCLESLVALPGIVGWAEKVHRARNQEVWVLVPVPLLTFR